MSTTSSHMLALMATVIEKRVQGLSWQAAGEAVQRSGETVRQWPTRYADEWDRLYRKAHRRIIHEAGNEGRTVLRSLAKLAKTEAVRRAAALDLVKLELQAEALQLKRRAARSSRRGSASSEEDELVALAKRLAEMDPAEREALDRDVGDGYFRDRLREEVEKAGSAQAVFQAHCGAQTYYGQEPPPPEKPATILATHAETSAAAAEEPAAAAASHAAPAADRTLAAATGPERQPESSDAAPEGKTTAPTAPAGAETPLVEPRSRGP